MQQSGVTQLTVTMIFKQLWVNFTKSVIQLLIRSFSSSLLLLLLFDFEDKARSQTPVPLQNPSHRTDYFRPEQSEHAMCDINCKKALFKTGNGFYSFVAESRTLSFL